MVETKNIVVHIKSGKRNVFSNATVEKEIKEDNKRITRYQTRKAKKESKIKEINDGDSDHNIHDGDSDQDESLGGFIVSDSEDEGTPPGLEDEDEGTPPGLEDDVKIYGEEENLASDDEALAVSTVGQHIKRKRKVTFNHQPEYANDTIYQLGYNFRTKYLRPGASDEERKVFKAMYPRTYIMNEKPISHQDDEGDDIDLAESDDESDDEDSRQDESTNRKLLKRLIRNGKLPAPSDFEISDDGSDDDSSIANIDDETALKHLANAGLIETDWIVDDLADPEITKELEMLEKADPKGNRYTLESLLKYDLPEEDNSENYIPSKIDEAHAKLDEMEDDMEDEAKKEILDGIMKTMFGVTKESEQDEEFKKYIDTQDEPMQEMFMYESNRMDELIKSIVPIKAQVILLNTSDHNKMAIWKMISRLPKLDSTERRALEDRIEWALSLPHDNRYPSLIGPNTDPMEIRKHLDVIKTSMDTKIYKMHDPIEQLISLYHANLINPHRIRNAVMLVGPPGVGKTYMVKTFTGLVQLPYYEIYAGGMSDSSILKGNQSVWNNAEVGLMVKLLKHMKYKNGIICVDEIDKCGGSHFGGTDKIAAVWMEIVDFVQNDKFHDAHIGHDIDIDLSQLFFVFLANNEQNIPAALKDRLPMIRVPGYSYQEKLEMTETLLIPKFIARNKFEPEEVVFPKDTIRHIIEDVNRSLRGQGILTNEKSGVRQIEDKLDQVLGRLALLKNWNIRHQTVEKMLRKGTKRTKVDLPPPEAKFSFQTEVSFPCIMTRELYDKLSIKDTKDYAWMSIYN